MNYKDLPDLPDDFSESKDWKESDYAGRIEWLLARVRSLRGEVEIAWEQAGNWREENYQLQKRIDHLSRNKNETYMFNGG